MTGSGTSADPYIVSTWGELVQAAANRDTYIELPKEPGTINIVKEYGKNEPPRLEIKSGVHINGNGWKIQGLWGRTHVCIYAEDDFWRDYSYMTNLIFSSFHSQGNYFLYSGSWAPLQIQNCVFSGKCEKDLMWITSDYSSGEKNGYIRCSSMTVEFTSLNSPHLFEVFNGRNANLPDFSDCNMKLKSIGELTLFNFYKTNNNKINIQDCRFDLTADNCKIFNTSSSGTIVSGCVFTGNSQSAIDIGNGTPQTRNFFDEETFPNTVESIKFMGVPHANIGDSAYLSQRGLSIGVSDG